MIEISDKAYCKMTDLTEEQIQDIEENLKVKNKQYENALRYSRYGRVNLPKFIYLYSRTRNEYVLPRGYAQSHLHKYKDTSIEVTVTYPKPVIPLKTIQKEAEKRYLADTTKGLIVLNTGVGKSVLGLHIAYTLRQKTLIIVHKTDLIVGWKKDCDLLFGGKLKPGLIKAQKFEIGEQITLATIQTLSKLPTEKKEQVFKEFGCVIVDEVHRAGSSSYDIVNDFYGAYRIGLTATLERADYSIANIFAMFGEVAYEYKIKQKQVKSKKEDQVILPVTVFCHDTRLTYVPKVTEDRNGYKHIKFKDWGNYSNLLKITDIDYNQRPTLNHYDIEDYIVLNKSYMNKVIQDITKEVKLRHKCVVAFKQKAHIDIYAQMLIKLGISCYKYYGDSKDDKDTMMKRANEVDVTLVTYGIATEGTNIKSWQTLFLVSSIADKKNTEQIVGRIRRTDGVKKCAYVYDYYHSNVYGISRHIDNRKRRYVELGFTIKEL